MNNVVTGILAVALVIVVGFAVLSKDNPQPAPTIPLGAVSGGDMYNKFYAYGGFAQGGVFTIATTASAQTLKDADLSNASVISLTAMGAGQAALALTLPASTTWSSLPKNGVVQRWVIDNVARAAATTTTITAGVGVDIDGTTANDDIINGDVSGTLSCWRLLNTDIRCIVEEMVDAG